MFAKIVGKNLMQEFSENFVSTVSKKLQQGKSFKNMKTFGMECFSN